MKYDSQSETDRYRHLVTRYCVPGLGIDIGSQGDPVVSWAWNFDLPPDKFAHYNSNYEPRGPIQLYGDCRHLPIASASLDFVYSSHLLEDFEDWLPVLIEWVRVLRPGGRLIILIPDRERWVAACAAGQPPNDAHRHEGHVGELSKYAPELGLQVLKDELTDQFPHDYSILFVAVKN